MCSVHSTCLSSRGFAQIIVYASGHASLLPPTNQLSRRELTRSSKQNVFLGFSLKFKLLKDAKLTYKMLIMLLQLCLILTLFISLGSGGGTCKYSSSKFPSKFPSKNPFVWIKLCSANQYLRVCACDKFLHDLIKSPN